MIISLAFADNGYKSTARSMKCRAMKCYETVFTLRKRTAQESPLFKGVPIFDTYVSWPR